MSRTEKLSGVLSDLEQAAALNRELKKGAVHLDWSAVEAASAPFLRALVQGLELDAVVDSIGAGSMAGPISDRVTQAFEGTLTDDAPLAAGGTTPPPPRAARPSAAGLAG